MDKKTQFLQWVDLQRYARKIKVADLSRRIGRHPEWVLNVVNGKVKFSEKTMELIAEAVKQYPIVVDINAILEINF